MTKLATSQRFPAIIIGGPPHTGKSALAYSLRDALIQADLQCYLLRAAPDGEGNWFHQADPALAQALRHKGAYTPAWIERMRYDLARRPMPFLVDVGGKPRPDREEFFDQCTHAILLVKDAESEAEWLDLMAKYNVPVIALLTSQQEGGSILTAIHPQIQGIITDLKWGLPATGPVFEAILNRVKALFSYSDEDIVTMHQIEAPTDLVLVINKLYQRLLPHRPEQNWQPQDLCPLFEYLPRNIPLGLYGIGPIWLYVAVARYIFPTPFYQFDARRGWVRPILIDPAAPQPPLKVVSSESEEYLHVKLHLIEKYLDYRPEMNISLPSLPNNKGLILEGQGPAWLYTGLAYFYQQTPWLGVYQPQLKGAVIVFSKEEKAPYKVGETVACSPILA